MKLEIKHCEICGKQIKIVQWIMEARCESCVKKGLFLCKEIN